MRTAVSAQLEKPRGAGIGPFARVRPPRVEWQARVEGKARVGAAAVSARFDPYVLGIAGCPATASPRARYGKNWNVPEEQVLLLWMQESAPGRRFRTRDGGEITIVAPGARNRYDGPDIRDAVILRGGEKRHGSIEVHVREEDWKRHGHGGDARYDGVVLHVCLLAERGARVSSPIPTIVLSEALPEPIAKLLARCREQYARRLPIPCAEEIHHASRAAVRDAIALAAAGRFERKSAGFLLRFRFGPPSPDPGRAPEAMAVRQALYESVARGLGYGGNEGALERLAREVPLQALIAAAPDDAGHRLAILERKADPIRNTAWNAGRVRPCNRPTQRLRALAVLAPLLASDAWWDEICDFLREAPGGGQSVFERMRRLLAPEALGHSLLGPDRVSELLVNCIAPCAHAFARSHSDERLASGASVLYMHLFPAPLNRITRTLAPLLGIGIPHESGTQQGLLELHDAYCRPARCSACLIGRDLER